MAVRPFSDCGTFRYLQDCIAKKKASVASWPMARCVSVNLRVASARMTQGGIAFCWISFGSSLAKAPYSRDRMKLGCRSLSLVGLGCPFSLKVEHTYDMVSQTVPLASLS